MFSIINSKVFGSKICIPGLCLLAGDAETFAKVTIMDGLGI